MQKNMYPKIRKVNFVARKAKKVRRALKKFDESEIDFYY